MENTLFRGDTIRARLDLNSVKLRNWVFAREFNHIGGGFTIGTRFRVAELGRTGPYQWVKVEIPGSNPIGYLKITGEEYSGNFEKSY